MTGAVIGCKKLMVKYNLCAGSSLRLNTSRDLYHCQTSPSHLPAGKTCCESALPSLWWVTKPAKHAAFSTLKAQKDTIVLL